MESIVEQIRLNGIVPVIKFDSVDSAVPLAETLIKNGLSIAEVTFRTDAAEESIRQIATAFPDMLVGAGTVLTIEHVDRAIGAGARFIVTPGFNRKIVEYCLKKNIPVFPGCNNPSVIEQALELGLTHLKFFPAEQSGGLAMIHALSGPYPSVAFMPTGGINENNITAYLKHPRVFGCGGSWMVKSALINEERYDEIGRLVKQALRLTLGFTLSTVCISESAGFDVLEEAKKLAQLLLLPVTETVSTVGVGTDITFMKQMDDRLKGRIEFGVYSVERACKWAEKQGYHCNINSVKYDDRGNKVFACLEELLCGFALAFVSRFPS